MDKVIDLDRSLSICMLLGHIKQWLLIWRSVPCTTTESTIWLLHVRQSAVHCSSSKCGRYEGISLRTAWFLHCSCSPARLLLLQILFIPLGLEIKTVFNVRFQGQAGPPQVQFQSRSKDGLGLRGPFWQFLVIARLSIWLSW